MTQVATKKRARVAQLVAEAVTVLCPECGEPQPNPENGSHLWTLDHFRADRLSYAGKVQFR